MDWYNKTELIKFLVHRYVNHPSIIGNLQLFVAFREKCICITADCVRPIRFLKTNQEEADTRMLLYAKHISPSISNVAIYILDTDVFVIVATCCIS